MNIHRCVIHKHPQARQGFHNCSRRAFRPSPHNPVRGCLFWNQRNTLIMNPITGPTMQVSVPSCPCGGEIPPAPDVACGMVRRARGVKRETRAAGSACRCRRLVHTALNACIMSPKLHCMGSNTSITPWKWSGIQTQACTATRLPCSTCFSGVCFHACCTASPKDDN